VIVLRTLPWTFFACGAVLTALATWLAAVNREPYSAAALGGLIIGTCLFGIGPLVASRQPANPIGWIISVCSALISFGGAGYFADQYARYALTTAPGSLPAVDVVLVLRYVAQNLGFFPLVTFVPLLFPTGHLASRRWRPVAAVAAISIVGVIGSHVFEPGPISSRYSAIRNPFGIEAVGPVLELLRGPILIAVFLAVGASVLSVFLRFRNARGVERMQLKWFAYGAAFLPVAFVIGVGITALGVPNAQPIISALYPLSIAPLAIAIGVAILRYRLYDFDVLINRTLVYGALTSVLVFTFFAGLLAIQAVLRPITSGSELAVAISTLLSFALFQPIRRRVQGAVDRRFDRSRYDAARTLDAFADRLRDEVDLDALRADLLSAVRQTMAPAHASLWLRERAR